MAAKSAELLEKALNHPDAQAADTLATLASVAATQELAAAVTAAGVMLADLNELLSTYLERDAERGARQA